MDTSPTLGRRLLFIAGPTAITLIFILIAILRGGLGIGLLLLALLISGVVVLVVFLVVGSKQSTRQDTVVRARPGALILQGVAPPHMVGEGPPPETQMPLKIARLAAVTIAITPSMIEMWSDRSLPNPANVVPNNPGFPITIKPVNYGMYWHKSVVVESPQGIVMAFRVENPEDVIRRTLMMRSPMPPQVGPGVIQTAYPERPSSQPPAGPTPYMPQPFSPQPPPRPLGPPLRQPPNWPSPPPGSRTYGTQQAPPY